MISNHLITEIEVQYIGDIWFEQDGAFSRTSHQSMESLREHSGDQISSCFGLVDWPARSFDITPLDLFLWGYVKSRVYANNPASIQALEKKFARVIRQLPVEMEIELNEYTI